MKTIVAWALSNPIAWMVLWFLLSIVASVVPTPKPDDPAWKKVLYLIAHFVSGSWGRFMPLIVRRFPQFGILAALLTETPSDASPAPSPTLTPSKAPADAPEQAKAAAASSEAPSGNSVSGGN